MNDQAELRSPPLLDAGRFDPVAEHSWTLPAHWYSAPEIYRLEHAAIFYRTWCYLGHVSDIAAPGDRIAGAVADRGVIAMRGEDGEIRAFCDADRKPVRIEAYGGFLFVNLDADAAPLVEQAPKFLRDMYAYCPRLDDLVRAERHEVVVAANWKTVIDNNHECYHCAANHKTLMEMVDYQSKAHWSDDGITFSHVVERKSLDSGAYALDAADAQQDSLFGYVWPTLIPLFWPGSPGAVLFQVVPTGPETTCERWDFYFTSREPSERERRLVDYIKNVLIGEDVSLCEKVQKGLNSRGYNQGRLVVDRARTDFSEHHVHFFQKFVHDALMSA